ncbi:MAG: SDR family oxidoreductase, partial [Elioraea sp.]|nr:SDR family oxidoreductase [Elioraea sp.]
IAAEIRAAGGEAIAIACNVLEEREVEALVAATVERLGGLDILVNNAGVGYLMKPIVELSSREWDAVLGVNLRGAFLCTKYAAEQ